MTNFQINTQKRFQLVDITEKIEAIVEKEIVKEGICHIFVAHSTAAIILTENESGLINDWLSFLKKMVRDNDFEHDRIDNNADSHLLSGLLGQGRSLPINKGRLIRGAWQQIFLLELDGPRNRKISVTITG